MRIKLDENLPASLAVALRSAGHDADTVPAEGLKGHADIDIWAAAQSAKRFLITQDLDFSDIRQYQPGTHFGILLLRLREPGRESLGRRVMELMQMEQVETWPRCFVVATDHKVRIVRPK